MFSQKCYCREAYMGLPVRDLLLVHEALVDGGVAQ